MPDHFQITIVDILDHGAVHHGGGMNDQAPVHTDYGLDVFGHKA
jgi:hypothetical protein